MSPRLTFARALGLRPDDPRHGTTNGYWNYRCRCRRCMDAVAAYNRAYYGRAEGKPRK